jgi:hypothetical protein
MVVTEIDKYLKSKKYSFYKLITKEWGAKDPDVIEIKKLWQAAEDANGTNSKIAKFRALQNKLQPMFDDWKKQDEENEAWLGKYNATQFSDAMDQHNYEFGKDFLAFSQMPTADKMTNLEIGDAFKEHYDVEQMTELAKQYGYDYSNKEERNEFLKNVGEYIRQQDLDAIWNGNNFDALYTGLITPIAKEYAQKNFDKIEGFGDLAPALAADVGVNTLMAGVPGGAVSKVTRKKAVQMAADNFVAPTVRQGMRVAMNDVDPEEATKAGISEVLTNYATPFAMRKTYNWGNRLVQGENAVNAQKYLNQYANKARETARKINEGLPFMEKIVEQPAVKGGRDASGNLIKPVPEQAKYLYKRYNPKTGKIEEISAEEYGKASSRITEKEMSDFGDFVTTLRGKKSIGEQYVQAQYMPKNTPAGEYNVEKKMYDASMRGQDPMSVLSTDELKQFGGDGGKETIMNWLWANPAVSDAGAYMTNLQGRSKYGGTMLGSLAQAVPGIDTDNFLEYTPKVNQDDPEVKMYKRNYLLHQANPDLVSEPKKPEKLKDYTIEEIFGE